MGSLPQSREGHVTFSTPDGLVMVCGGYTSSTYHASCLRYNLEEETWTQHSNLSKARTGAAVVTLAGGVYVMGGDNRIEYYDTTEFLAVGSSLWTPGPQLPGGSMTGACAVPLTDHSFLLISAYAVVEYSSLTAVWTSWPPPLVARSGQACHKVDSTVLVAGGFVQGGVGVTNLTVIIDLVTKQVRKGGDMATARWNFGMFEVGFRGRSVLLTFGNYGPDQEDGLASAEASLLQEWNREGERWIPSPGVIDPRDSFAAATVEARLVCKPGEIERCAMSQLFSSRRLDPPIWKPPQLLH